MRRRVALGDRGRVPFALVGVVLVVASATFAAGVDRPARPPEPAVDLAMERTAADARTALRQAVARAAVAAASDPVVTPADTPYGRVLDEDEPFRDALRIRVYLLARERFASIGRTHRGVRATVSLPATPDPDALARSIERVSVERAGPNGTSLDVTVRNVTQAARRDGRVVGRRNLTLSVQVRSPVLAVHDRVVEFQERLDANITEPGLGRTVTARLYAVAWARGYAQYGGAPVENVVSNRHVSLVTNGALLALQRSVFGESDSDGRASHARAAGALALTELVAGAGARRFAGANHLLRERIRAGAVPSEHAGVRKLRVGGSGATGPGDLLNVSVGETADRAFAPYARDQSALDATIRSVFAASVRTLGRSTRVDGGRPPAPDPPDRPGEWQLVGEDTHTTVGTVAAAASGPPVSTPEGYHRFYDYERLVTLTHDRVRTWRHNGTVARTVARRTERRRVTVAVVGRHATTPHAPANPIATVHEPAGPFGGPNLAGVEATANETVVAARGGPDALAAATARGRLDESATTVRGAWPATLRAWVYRDLADLREKVRAMSVAVRRGRLGTFEANPAARLHDRIERQRSALLDAPATYDHVAAKARVALRGQYLDRVLRALARRARSRDRREQRIAATLRTRSRGSLSLLRRSLRARRVDADRDDAGALQLTVDGAPPYLTLAGVNHGRVSAVEGGTTVHPLVARNVNVATVPYGEATDAVLHGLGRALSGEPTVRLRTAVAALDSVDDAYRATGNASLAARRSSLRDEVEASLANARSAVATTLGDHGVDDPAVRREVVSTAFSRPSTLRGRALAVSNRSVVGAVVDATAARRPDMSAVALDRLRLDLRNRLARALDGDAVGVSGPAVSAATHRVKAVVGARVEAGVSDVVRRRLGRTVSGVPAGIPLLPPVAPWYATANVWWVTVGGRYERFAVEAPRRTPAAADASLSYVRDGANVTLDADGDGEGELFGRASRVSFRFTTGVVVVVPSGRTGVGDVDGNLDERSPGWRYAGPANVPHSGNGTAGALASPPAEPRARRNPGDGRAESDSDL